MKNGTRLWLCGVESPHGRAVDQQRVVQQRAACVAPTSSALNSRSKTTRGFRIIEFS
jgi:hypothetical protein